MEVDKLNPLDIPEVLQCVLEYVGGVGVNGGNSQLLKARLACRSWNVQATKLITPTTMPLSETELNSARGTQLVQLLVHYDKLVPGVGLRLKLEMTQQHTGRYNANADRVLLFMNQISDLTPITILHLNSAVELHVTTFCKLIKTVAPSLKELKTRAQLYPTNRFLFVQEQEMIEQETLSFDNIQFPNLEALDFIISPPITIAYTHGPQQSFPPIPNPFINLIQKSSGSLKSLKVFQETTQSPGTEDKIKRLIKLLNETANTLNHLRHLEITLFGDENLLESFCSMGFNNLKTLMVRQVLSYHLQPVFLQFLLYRAPCLTHLQILLMLTNVNPLDFEFDQLHYLPVITKIKDLSLISIRPNSLRLIKNLLIMSQIFTNVTNFMLDTKTCLKLIDVPLIVQSLQEGGEYEQCVYPATTTLCISAEVCSRTTISQDDFTTLRLICNRIWPNVTRLIIEEVDEVGRLNMIQSGALCTLLSLHDGITTLQLKTRIMETFGDWMTEIFRPNPQIQQLKQSLRGLNLCSLKTLNPIRHVAADISKYLYNICGTFSALERCCIEETLLSNYEQLGLEELLDLMVLRTQFPNISFERFVQLF